MMLHPGVLLSVVSLAIGWLALFPVRRHLGATGYHLASFPVGLLGWVLVATAAVTFGSGYTVWLVTGALLVWIALVACAGRFMANPRDCERPTNPVPWWSYLVILVVIAAFSSVIARAGITTYTMDSWAAYEPTGILLADAGTITEGALGHRMSFVPSIHAAYRFFGGEFTYVIQPVMGLVTAALLCAALLWSALARLKPAFRIAGALAITLLMVTNSSYLFQSIYVHSHMITAMYLMLALIAAERAWHALSTDMTPDAFAWLLVSGLATTGLLLARPDGPVYALVPILTTATLLLHERATGRTFDAYFAPIVVVSLLVISGTIVHQGFWETGKLSVWMLTALVGLHAFIWLAFRLTATRKLPWLRAGTNAPRIALGITALALTIIARRGGANGAAALIAMTSNLSYYGGYRFVWIFAGALIVLSLAIRPRSTRHRFSAYLLFAIVMFFSIAFTVHALTHPGHRGWTDSFNRVAFHIMPAIYLYAGFYLGELLSALPSTRRSMAEE